MIRRSRWFFRLWLGKKCFEQLNDWSPGEIQPRDCQAAIQDAKKSVIVNSRSWILCSIGNDNPSPKPSQPAWEHGLCAGARHNRVRGHHYLHQVGKACDRLTSSSISPTRSFRIEGSFTFFLEIEFFWENFENFGFSKILSDFSKCFGFSFFFWEIHNFREI